jgi:hypothetical protein
VGAPGLPASPPRGPAIDIYDIDESTLNHLCIINMTVSQGDGHVTSCN